MELIKECFTVLVSFKGFWNKEKKLTFDSKWEHHHWLTWLNLCYSYKKLQLYDSVLWNDNLSLLTNPIYEPSLSLSFWLMCPF